MKILTRQVWQRSKGRIDAHRLEPQGKKIYQRRKETVERSFADAKQLHGHRFARMRGQEKVQEQSLLAAWAQNIKKIALLLNRMGPQLPPGTRKSLLQAYTALLQLIAKLTPPPTTNR